MAYAKDANYAYTIRDWVESINDVGSPGGNFAAEYEYASKNGNITKATFNNPDIEVGGIPNDYWYDFSYDGLNRLTEADYDYPGFDDTGAHDFDVRGLAYDRAGNIDNLQRWDDSGSLIDDLTYSYSGNQLQSLTDAVSTTSDSWDAETASNFDYDANGNLTSQSGKFTEITYDHRNLPIQFALATGDTVIANYNADGQRIFKELTGGSWQFYVNDGQQTLAVVKDSTLSHINLIGNQTFGRIDADTSGAINNTNARRYYITDHLGSTRAVIDNGGNVLETFDYYPFGLLMPSRNGGTNTTLEKFTGKERDNEGGLNLDYFGARYLDPAIGRWMSIDPLASMYPMINPYNYALNNPVRLIDKFGLCPEGYEKGDVWNGSQCGPTVEVTATRIPTANPYFIRSSGKISFDPGKKEGRDALYNYFYNNSDQVPNFIANKKFSVQSKSIAMDAYRAKGEAVFWTHAYHITVSGVSIFSAATGAGAVGLGVRALITGGSGRLLAGQLSKMSLKASITESASRIGGFSAGIDTKKTLTNSLVNTAGSAIIALPSVKGVNYSKVSGPIFRSVNTGRFVSNTYGGLRIGITNGTQLGLIYSSFGD